MGQIGLSLPQIMGQIRPSIMGQIGLGLRLDDGPTTALQK
jgi:hypothetical protein